MQSKQTCKNAKQNYSGYKLVIKRKKKSGNLNKMQNKEIFFFYKR